MSRPVSGRRERDGGGPAPGDAQAAGGEEVALAVESVAHGGDGVAREPDGRVVFVPRTAPGDRVLARVVEEHGSYARARVEEVVVPSPRRRDPPCPFYDACGGCQLQHLDAGAEVAAKGEAVDDALERIAGRRTSVEGAVAVGPRFGYRNRVTFTLRRTGEAVTAGYHRRDEPGRLVDVDECPLAEPPLREAWHELRRAWGAGAGRLPGAGEIRLTLRATGDGRVGLLAAGGEERRPGDPESLFRGCDRLASYHWKPADGERRRLAGHDRLTERWRGRELEVGPGTFLQVNRVVADAIEDHLDRRLGELAGCRLLDLYAGVGLRALRWRERGAEVAACEVAEEAVADGLRAAEAAGVQFPFRAARVEEALPQLLPADDVVVNPPRRGLSESVCGLLAEADVQRIAYVSCDPATLARDVERLGGGWRVGEVQPFDAFPQTSHVETVLWLHREAEAGATAEGGAKAAAGEEP